MPVNSSDVWVVSQLAVLSELKPKMPVFKHMQFRVEAEALHLDRVHFEKHCMDR